MQFKNSINYIPLPKEPWDKKVTVKSQIWEKQ